jgi:hypothetical protein
MTTSSRYRDTYGESPVTETTAALGLFRGPDLIVEAVNAELERLTGRPCVGFPAREVWYDAQARTAQALMAAVLCDGVTRSHPAVDWEGRPGIVTIQAMYEGAERWGVVTEFRAAPVPTSSVPPRESLQEVR